MDTVTVCGSWENQTCAHMFMKCVGFQRGITNETSIGKNNQPVATVICKVTIPRSGFAGLRYNKEEPK